MARTAGRPPRPSSIEPALLEATHAALIKMGKELGLPSGRYTDPITGKERTRLKPLELAALAIQAQEALEVLAAREVMFVKEHDDLTWVQVGDAFDISPQSAHHRFARK